MKPALVIIGLGNKGSQYSGTRHNVGWQALDELENAFGEGEWQEKKSFNAHVLEARISTFPVLLVKPDTFMNRSGESTSKIVQFFKLDPSSQVLVIVDDIDIDLGAIRLRMSGGPGTHNGLKSVIQCLGEDVPRMRIGIGPKPMGDLSNWVLSTFSSEERESLSTVLPTIPAALEEFVFKKSDTSWQAGEV